MWINGFIVDKNLRRLHKLGLMLREKGVDVVIPESEDSEVICSQALE
jgi:ferredoxin-fold anticodon binding domain-containing protein